MCCGKKTLLSGRLKEHLVPGETPPCEVPHPWQKCVLAWEHERLLEVERFLKTRTGCFRTVFSERMFLDILHRDASKGGALQRLAELCGAEYSEIAAIGDNMNDLELLQYADYSGAMGEAPAALKAAADFIAPGCNEDGVAVFVHRYVDRVREEDTVR